MNRTLTTPRLARSCQEDGFTLIELMIAILIVGLLGSIVIPVHVSQQREAAGETVKADVVSTGMEASAILMSNTADDVEAVVDVVETPGNTTRIFGSWDNYIIRTTNAEAKPSCWQFDSLTGETGACRPVADPLTDATRGF